MKRKSLFFLIFLIFLTSAYAEVDISLLKQQFLPKDTLQAKITLLKEPLITLSAGDFFIDNKKIPIILTKLAESYYFAYTNLNLEPGQHNLQIKLLYIENNILKEKTFEQPFMVLDSNVSSITLYPALIKIEQSDLIPYFKIYLTNKGQKDMMLDIETFDDFIYASKNKIIIPSNDKRYFYLYTIPSYKFKDTNIILKNPNQEYYLPVFSYKEKPPEQPIENNTAIIKIENKTTIITVEEGTATINIENQTATINLETQTARILPSTTTTSQPPTIVYQPPTYQYQPPPEQQIIQQNQTIQQPPAPTITFTQPLIIIEEKPIVTNLTRVTRQNRSELIQNKIKFNVSTKSLVKTIHKKGSIEIFLEYTNTFENPLYYITLNLTNNLESIIDIKPDQITKIDPTETKQIHIWINKNKNAEEGEYQGELLIKAREIYQDTFSFLINVIEEKEEIKQKSYEQETPFEGLIESEDPIEDNIILNYSKKWIEPKSKKPKESKSKTLWIVLGVIALMIFIAYKLIQRKKPITYKEYLTSMKR